MNGRSLTLWVIRVAAALSLVLGIVIWPGNSDNLIPAHIAIGVVVAIALLVLGVMGIMAKVSGLGAIAMIWALVMTVLGLMQGAFPESVALAVQLFHLILGVGAWVVAEVLARRMA